MVEQSDFPEKWVCDSDEKSVAVEVRVPTQSAELQELMTMATYEGADFGEDTVTFTYSDTADMEPPLRGEITYSVVDSIGVTESRFAFIEIQDAETEQDGDTTTFTIPYEDIRGFDREDVRMRRDLEQGPFVNDRSHTWIEIPTQSVEMWVEKGDAAQIQRTAKVQFPTEWGENTSDVIHNSPRDLVTNYDPSDSSPFMMARVWFQNPGNDDWVLEHFGWVGGAGQTEDMGISKLWVYDLAELLSGVPIGASFTNPSIKTAAEEIARLTNGNTPAPISDVVIMQPETEAEFTQVAANYATPGETGIDSFIFGGAGSDAVEGDPNLVGPDGDDATGAYYSLKSDEILQFEDLSRDQRADESQLARLPKGAEDNFEAVTIDTPGLVEGFGWDSKSFIANHDTLLDVWEWFEEKTGAKLHFEPRADSVILVADIVPERRTFAQTEVIQQYRDNGNEDYEFHADVVVEKNDALYEMKPINTLQVRGDTPGGLVDAGIDFIEGAIDLLGGGPPPAEKYPVVKVQVPELVEAANGTEMSPEVVESDTRDLDTAEREAVREMSNRLSEASEGEIVLQGTPRVLPFDKVEAFEVCNSQVQYEQQPVQYEVESVKHKKTSDGLYKTSVRVSVWANDQNIETLRKEMVEVQT